MKSPSSPNPIIQQLQVFYDTFMRMPSYSEIAEIMGVSSKESAYRRINQLVQAGELYKDAQGKLLPRKDFLRHSANMHITAIRDGIPLLGMVEAGLPSDVEQQDLDIVSLDEWIVGNNTQMYMLLVKGDSMINAGIHNGDRVIVDRGRTARIGDIVIARIDEGITMKYLQSNKGILYLQPANPDFPDIYPENDLEVQAVVTTIIRKLY